MYHKHSFTSFKQRLPPEFHGNNNVNMVIFLLKLILGSVGQWSRSRPSVKMDQLVCQAFFVAVVVFFFFRFFFTLACFALFLLLTHYSFARFLR